MYSRRRLIHGAYFLALFLVFAGLAALSQTAPRIIDFTAAERHLQLELVQRAPVAIGVP
jgi:hypothetical protein